jgi:hypothetical protein
MRPRPLDSARRHAVVLAAVAMLVGSIVGLASPAQAAPSGTGTKSTASGLTLSVTPVRGLSPTGTVIRVSGKGYNRTVGIYVALCITPRKGTMPSDCGGGVNTSGTNPASRWISSNPPPYGAKLAIPFKPGGRFSVRVQVSPMIGALDCRTVSCSIVTRADHTRAGDRRFDVAVRVRFASSASA